MIPPTTTRRMPLISASMLLPITALLFLICSATATATSASTTSACSLKSNGWISTSRKRTTINPLLSLSTQTQQPPFSSLLLVDNISRGGALSDSENEDSDEDDEVFDLDFDSDDLDDEDLEIDDEAFDVAEEEFAEAGRVDLILQAWSKTPPFTKAYLSASMIATGWGFLFGKNEFPSILTLEWPYVIKRLQLWRPLTSFLNFGPLGLGYLLTLQFVWTYMSTLERLNHNRPYDFWIMVLFGQLSMVIGYPLMKLSPRFLGHNLSTYLVYIWSRYHEGQEVNMFELFNARAEMLPWFFLAQVSVYVCLFHSFFLFVCL